ncbi:hypothetical protein [Legionella birminghamensis]|nr:hypothetical protein [Legionella birminghamensis]
MISSIVVSQQGISIQSDYFSGNYTMILKPMRSLTLKDTAEQLLRKVDI